MINLLPNTMKKDIRASRTNTVLLRYNLILVTAVIFLAGATSIVYVFLGSIKTSAETTIQENLQKESSYTNIKQQAELFRTNLSDAKSILDSDVSYSNALVRYAKLFPDGTAVDSMKLDEKSFGAPLNVTVKITGQSAAKALIDSMSTSPYVSNFTRKSISISSDKTYPYSMDITFTLKKEIAKL